MNPAPGLARYVQCYAEFIVPEPPLRPYPHLVMPDGCAHLTYLRPAPRPGRAVVLTGPRMASAEHSIAGRLLCWDVKLRPFGLGLLGQVGAEWRDRVAPVAAAGPNLERIGAALESALASCTAADDARGVFDDRLAALLPHAHPIDAIVEAAVRAIEASDGAVPVAELARSLEISERQLQRRFRRAVGITPKQFARVRRFRACARNLIAIQPEAWGRVATTHGYADQAHLSREFALLSGRAPTRLASYISRIEHGKVDV